MFKLGIVKYEQLERRPRTWFGGQRHASVLLLRELFQRASRNQAHYNAILRLLLTANGTWKDTYQGRFAPLDEAVLEILRDLYPSSTRLMVADLGVSSGITSVELYQKLSAAFTVDFLATDIWRDAFAICAPRSGWTIVLDRDGEELQHIIGPFVLPGQGHEPMLYPVNKALRRLSRRFFVPRARAIYRQYRARQHADFETAFVDGFEVVKLPLLAPECLELAARCKGFRFEVANIMEAFRWRADVIRAVNIITPIHFDEPQLRRAIRDCLRALNPGGILILGRSLTDDPRELKATIYRKRGDTMQSVRQFGGGCEVEALVAEEQTALHANGQSRPPSAAA